MSCSIAISSLPTCRPNLMPFHVAYDGPALISTFMHIEPAKTAVGGPSEQSSGSAPENTSDISNPNPDEVMEAVHVSLEAGGSDDAATKEGLTKGVVEGQSEVSVDSNSSTRFVSTFRGRIIQGLKVDIPEGYAGLTLRVPQQKDKQGSTGTWASDSETPPTAKGKGKRITRTKHKGRLTRSAVSKRVIDVDEEDAMMVERDDDATLDDDLLPEETLSPLRNLIPSSQFSSFVIWHPDNPVDEGRDEYFRALHEWTKLAAELHQPEDIL